MSNGFYKLDKITLLFGPNYVLNQTYELVRDQHDTYEYPVDGWYWFESDEAAREFFNLPPVEQSVEPSPELFVENLNEEQQNNA